MLCSSIHMPILWRQLRIESSGEREGWQRIGSFSIRSTHARTYVRLSSTSAAALFLDPRSWPVRKVQSVEILRCAANCSVVFHISVYLLLSYLNQPVAEWKLSWPEKLGLSVFIKRQLVVVLRSIRSMKVLCLSLLALFLRGQSFSSYRTLQRQLSVRSDNAVCRNVQHLSKRSSLSMHMGHSHSHDHHDDDDHDHDKMNRSGPELSFSLWGQFLRPKEMLLHRPQGKVFLAALLVLIPALIRKKFTKLDFGIFAATAVSLSVFDSARFAVKKYMSKIKMFQESLVKHSTPLTRKYFFKNENAADRITLAGVYINIILSLAKFFGGIGETCLFYFIIP